jgi:hypothetical protein
VVAQRHRHGAERIGNGVHRKAGHARLLAIDSAASRVVTELYQEYVAMRS